MVSKSLLCVGGPLSGQRMEAQSDVGFTVPVMKPDQSPDPNNPSAQTEYTMHAYRAEAFHVLDDLVEFWVPRDQTPRRSMELLLGSFERNAPVRVRALAPVPVRMLAPYLLEMLIELVDPDNFDTHPQDFSPPWHRARDLISRAQGFNK